MKLTLEQAIIISGYTGILACAFTHVHEDVEKRLNRPVFTHEFGSQEFKDELESVYKADFLSICFESKP